MSGALLIDGQFVAVFPRLVRLLGGDLTCAAVLQAIHYRTMNEKPDAGHQWSALTLVEIGDELGISRGQAHTATQKLRALGLLLTRGNQCLEWAIDRDALEDFTPLVPKSKRSSPSRNQNGPFCYQNGDRSNIKTDTLLLRTKERIVKSPNPENGVGHAVEKADAPLMEARQLCLLLADLIEANGSKRPTVTNGWVTAMDRLMRLDGRTPAQVEAAIRWCQGDEFWRANVLSPSKLREKYDQMRLQAARQDGGGNRAKHDAAAKADEVIRRLQEQERRMGNA